MQGEDDILFRVERPTTVGIRKPMVDRKVEYGGIVNTPSRLVQGVLVSVTSGEVEIKRTSADVAILSQPGQPAREITLARRNLRDCLIEDLRRLDSDDLFGEVITKGFGAQFVVPAVTGPAGQLRSKA